MSAYSTSAHLILHIDTTTTPPTVVGARIWDTKDPTCNQVREFPAHVLAVQHKQFEFSEAYDQIRAYLGGDGWFEWIKPILDATEKRDAGEEVEPPPNAQRCSNCCHWSLTDDRSTPRNVQKDPPFGVCLAEDRAGAPMRAVSDGSVAGTFLETLETFRCPLWAPAPPWTREKNR